MEDTTIYYTKADLVLVLAGMEKVEREALFEAVEGYVERDLNGEYPAVTDHIDDPDAVVWYWLGSED